MQTTLALVVAVVLLAAYAISFLAKKKPRLHVGVENIKPVDEKFSWDTQPVKNALPYKTSYKTSMNVSRTSHDDWLLIDKDYKHHTDLHSKIIEETPDDELCLANPSPDTRFAVWELYQYVFSTYIKRYPQHFSLSNGFVHNKIRDVLLPFGPAAFELPSRELLVLLMQNTQEDYFLLGYEPEFEEYVMRASTGVAALGFLWKSKMDIPLSEIHEPVPEYETKLRAPMTKTFEKLQPGNFIERCNWQVQVSTKDNLFNPGRTHMKEGVPIDFVNGAFSRVERQVITKLPVSKWLVFSMHTYMYSLAESKELGKGHLLASMINSMNDEMAEYKDRHLWGPQALEYLGFEQSYN